jgi:hypothetical protein
MPKSIRNFPDLLLVLQIMIPYSTSSALIPCASNGPTLLPAAPTTKQVKIFSVYLKKLTPKQKHDNSTKHCANFSKERPMVHTHLKNRALQLW